MGLWIIALAFLPAVFGAHSFGSDSEYFDILNRGAKEWRLVFRGQAGIEKSVHEAYTTGNNIPADVPEACKQVDWSLPCDSHYRNMDALDNWGTQPVKQVLFGIVDNGAMVKTILFNGIGTNIKSWFSDSQYMESCFEDMETKTKNIFSIDGFTDGPNVNRRFFINHKYGGCPNDDGWVVALDGPTDRYCDWETDLKFPVFKYSSGLHHMNWNKLCTKVADAIVIFVRYEEHHGEPEEYFDLYDSGMKDYRLAFRGTARAGVPMYNAYMLGQGIPDVVEPACRTTDWELPCTSHWRNNDALDNWFDIEEIVFGIVANGTLLKTITFNGWRTNYYNWFMMENLKTACGWKDLDWEMKNFFSIKGMDDGLLAKRHFYISNHHGGCANDAGWVVAIDNPQDAACDWERADYIPKLMYAGGPRVDNWTSGDILEADAFVVFLKYHKC